MKRILITGIGGDIAQGVATLVRGARPGARLVGSDTHEQHAGRLFVDECLILPPARDPGYGAALREVLARHQVDLLMPMTEAEIGVMDSSVLGAPQVPPWVGPGVHVVAAGLDKLATARSLAALGLPVPWTVAAGAERPPEYPCVLKPRFGSGSRAVFTIDNDEAALCLAKKYPQSVFQELLQPADAEVTCAVYRTRDGRVATLQLLRRLVGGLTGWARVIRDEAVEHMCKAIAEGLGLAGSMNVQLRITAAGPRVFEINPRFSSTAVMRHLMGFTDVVWTLDELDGHEVSPAPVALGRVGVRLQRSVILI
jgi:carbamoyl-phosphate synthase large subunit